MHRSETMIEKLKMFKQPVFDNNSGISQAPHRAAYEDTMRPDPIQVDISNEYISDRKFQSRRQRRILARELSQSRHAGHNLHHKLVLA